jgi:hypothetical protein
MSCKVFEEEGSREVEVVVQGVTLSPRFRSRPVQTVFTVDGYVVTDLRV